MRARGGLVAELVLFAACFDLVACLVWAPSLAPMVLAAALLWWFAAPRRNFLARAGRDFSAPVVAGLTMICLALAGLNGARSLAQPQQVQATEDWLARARLGLEEWTHLSVVRLVIVGTVLLALAATAPNLKPVTRFNRARSIIGYVKILLLTLTSLTVYAQPLLQAVVHRVHARVVNEYRAAIEKQVSADAQTAAARTLRTGVRSIPPRERRLLGRQLRAIRGTVDSADRIASVENPVFEPDSAADASGEVPRIVRQSPTSVHKLARQQQAADARKARADQSVRRAQRETREAVRFLADETLGLVVPRLGVSGLPAGFANELIDSFRSRVAEPIANRLTAKERSSGALVGAELSDPEIASIARARWTRGQAARTIEQAAAPPKSLPGPPPPQPDYLVNGMKVVEHDLRIVGELGGGFLKHVSELPKTEFRPPG